MNPVASLADVLKRYRFAYLMTVSPDGSPRATVAKPRLEGGELVVDDPGARSGANASARPGVGLVWPPQIESDYSLIVDGRARVVAGSLWIAPTRAVLHRPGAMHQSTAAKGCASDCIELSFSPIPAG